jgi:hypothetical protein
MLALRHLPSGTVVTVVPMAKKDTASQRLAEEIALAKFTREPGLASMALGRYVPRSGPEELPASLRLDEDNQTWSGPLLDAFKAFDLDHRNIRDWRLLVSHLAHVLFPRRRSGRPQIWTDEQLWMLLMDVAEFKRKHPKASDTAICNWLKKKWPNSPARLRRALQDARNPARAARMADFLMTRLEMQIVMEGKAWTEAHKEAARAYVRRIIPAADKLWATERKTAPRIPLK